MLIYKKILKNCIKYVACCDKNNYRVNIYILNKS